MNTSQMKKECSIELNTQITENIKPKIYLRKEL